MYPKLCAANRKYKIYQSVDFDRGSSYMHPLIFLEKKANQAELFRKKNHFFLSLPGHLKNVNSYILIEKYQKKDLTNLSQI